MVFHRAILVASAIFLAAGMSAAAFAGCGGCGFEAGPAAYAQPVYPQPAPSTLSARYSGTRSTARGGCSGAARRRSLGYGRMRDLRWMRRRLRFGGCGGCGGFLGFNGCNCGRSIGYARRRSTS